MAQEHWYHVYIDIDHLQNRIRNRHIASFLTEDDAYTFAKETRDYYFALGDICYVRIIYDGKTILEFFC